MALRIRQLTRGVGSTFAMGSLAAGRVSPDRGGLRTSAFYRSARGNLSVSSAVQTSFSACSLVVRRICHRVLVANNGLNGCHCGRLHQLSIESNFRAFGGDPRRLSKDDNMFVYVLKEEIRTAFRLRQRNRLSPNLGRFFRSHELRLTNYRQRKLPSVAIRVTKTAPTARRSCRHRLSTG